jgi:rhamnulose-1-phosphate aldolase/alcohol dehydrogenase
MSVQPYPRWDDAKTAGMTEPQLLLYRSNLLGSDLRITNYGGGNTSAKIRMADPLTGEEVDVLWVKGSGGDIGSMKMDGFATLYMDKLHALKRRYRGLDHEDEMVAYFPHCAFDLNPRATSIDTPPHCFTPARHIDHMHADALIAFAAAKNGAALIEKAFGDEIGWIPWMRPGFELGLRCEALVAANPTMTGLIFGSHGLVNWADTSKACYQRTISIIERAAAWLDANGRKEPFGPQVVAPMPEAERLSFVAELGPLVRGLLSANVPKVMHYNDSAAVLEFVGAARGEELAAKGTTCPDHFLRTKILPLWVPFTPGQDTPAQLAERIGPLVERYATDYAAYYERCKRADSPAMRDPMPVLLLIPGIGMLAFQKDKQTARVAAEYFVNTINVVRWAEGVDTYVPIPEQEAFDIEYWLLEEAKLQRLPKPKALEGRIALVTGGAGGIGQAVARRLLAEGAHVVLTDRDQASLDEARTGLGKAYGADKVRGFVCDVRDESSVAASMAYAAAEYGGLDILVSNAGIASASAIEATTLATWQLNMDILATGYFLVGRDAFALMKRQGLGGSIVFVGSKNALVASPGASAYCSAKAAALHLARCLAAEGAPIGVRANVVNPDAVIRGSRIWSGTWRSERAASNKIDETDVEEFYRQRSMLKRTVLPEDVAEAVYFLASPLADKSTGNILNVDAGNLTAFTR